MLLPDSTDNKMILFCELRKKIQEVMYGKKRKPVMMVVRQTVD